MNPEELYLDYTNNFLSLEGFAEYYNLSLADANIIIEYGRLLNNKRGVK